MTCHMRNCLKDSSLSEGFSKEPTDSSLADSAVDELEHRYQPASRDDARRVSTVSALEGVNSLTTELGEDIWVWRQFWWLFLMEVFSPWIQLIIWPLYGKETIHNHKYFGSGFLGSGLFLPLATFWIVVGWLYRSTFEAAGVHFTEVVQPFVILVAHRGMVALKWASVTPDEYEKFLTAPFPVAELYNRKLQLLSGWLFPSDEVLIDELKRASRTTRSCLESLEVVQEPRGNDWRRSRTLWLWLLAEAEGGDARLEGLNPFSGLAVSGLDVEAMHTSHEEKDLRMSAFQLLMGLMRLANVHARKSKLNRLPVVFPLLPTFCYAYVRASTAYASTGSVFEAVIAAFCFRSPLVAAFTLSSVYIWYFVLMLLLMFKLTGVFHYHRMRFVLEILSFLPRTAFATHPNLPQLQVDGPHATEHIKVIVTCFEMVVQFGSRYKRRMDTILIGYGGFWLMALFFLVMQVMLEPRQFRNAYPEAGVQELPPDAPQSLPLSRSTCIIIYVASVISFMLFIICKQGDASNKCFGRLANNIQSARWRLRAHCRDEDLDDELLALAVERLASMAEARPVCLGGHELNLDLGYSLLSAVFTSIAYILTQKLGLNLPI